MLERISTFFNPERFQGRHKRKSYFEGWYYKIIDASEKYAFAIIPETIEDPDFFETVSTEDVVFPSRGFTNIFPLYNTQIEYFNVWMSIQNLDKVRQFLSSNPNQKVQIFMYAPNYYASYSAWDYYIFIKN